ncbi:MAG: hypothetical protein WC809_17900 [Sinimarinibacterium sp.]
MLLAALTVLAIVSNDQVALRAAPSKSAPLQTLLGQGDALEVRGRQLDYLQVWDHRRERGGYVHVSQARSLDLDAPAASELLAVVRFLRDSAGDEALGIAYVGAYLKAAPAQAITAEPFDALGRMAERLADRASARSQDTGDARLSARLETAASYGVAFNSIERDGRVSLCYDGDAFRRVLALPASAEQQAHAALALTRHDCIDPALRPSELHALNQWRADVLDRVDAGALPELLRNRVHQRRAGVLAGLAYEDHRQGGAARDTATRALDELARVVRTGLTDDDRAAYTDAAVRVGASRWAAQPDTVADAALTLATAPGEPGQTCVSLLDRTHPQRGALVTRCTYGTVWSASAAVNRNGTALALAVQPLPTWRELWVFQRRGDAWTVRVLPPAASDPTLGYVEFAGWVAGKDQMLVAREAQADGRWQRSFEVVSLDTLAVDLRASEPTRLSAFYRWQSPTWKAQTVSLR